MDLVSIVILAVIAIAFLVGLRRILRTILSKEGGCGCGSADCTCRTADKKEHKEHKPNRLKAAPKAEEAACPHCAEKLH